MRSLHRFLSHWQNWLGLVLVLAFVFVALAAPLLSPVDKKTVGSFKQVGRATDLTPHPPSANAILGTLPGQYDVLHTLVWGARDAMQFGLLVALGAFAFGVLFGAVSGYAGGWINNLLMRIADAFLTFPVLAGVVFLQQMVAVTINAMGGTFWFNSDLHGRVVDFQFTPPPFAAFLLRVDPILVALILFSWMPIARIVNTLVITLKNTDFIQATRSLGGGPFWIIRRHLIPNSIGPAMVLTARDVGSSVILQATITFIGLGGQSAWGILLSMGRNWVIGPGGDLFANWWVFLPVTLAIVLFGISWNLLGDGLTDMLEPTHAVSRRVLFSKREQARAESEAPSTMPVASRPTTRSIDPVILSKLPHVAAPLTEEPPKVESPEPESPNIAPVHARIPDSRPAVEPVKTLPVTVDPILKIARRGVSKNDLTQALHAYSHLIESGKLLDTVVQDLSQVVRVFPHDAKVWKVLGDALARDGKTDYAAKAYERSRQLTQ